MILCLNVPWFKTWRVIIIEKILETILSEDNAGIYFLFGSVKDWKFILQSNVCT